MCGICAIVGTPPESTNQAIERMTAALKHRGPDAQSWQRLAGADLGHARLSIIDLEGGSQPMSDASRRHWVLSNGTKVRDGETKILFKHTLRRFWPNDIEMRKKQRFAAPFKMWLLLSGKHHPAVHQVMRSAMKSANGGFAAMKLILRTRGRRRRRPPAVSHRLAARARQPSVGGLFTARAHTSTANLGSEKASSARVNS